MPLLTDDDYYREFFGSFVQGKIDAYASPSSEAARQAVETIGALGAELPLSDELLELIDEVAAMRQLQAPSTLHIRTVSRRDLSDAYLGYVGAETEAERFALEQETKLFRVLGYLEEDEHLRDIQRSLTEHILGFYSPQDRDPVGRHRVRGRGAWEPHPGRA